MIKPGERWSRIFETVLDLLRWLGRAQDIEMASISTLTEIEAKMGHYVQNRT